MNPPADIAEQFELAGRPREARPFGSGNIHQTFLLTTDADELVLLQKLNPDVFRFPDRIMQNLSLVNHHMATEIRKQGLDRTQWHLPQIIRTRNGRDYHTAVDGSCWRALDFIRQTVTLDSIQTPQQAEQAGLALGRFHRLTHNLDPSELHDPLPGFHDTPRYLEHYDQVLRTHRCAPGEVANYCRRVIEAHRHSVSILEDARKTGQIRIRCMHGDPKVSNILFDEKSGGAVALVDLDTVKPGLIQYDIGDFFRSACNPAGEEAENPDTVLFDLQLFKNGLTGYMSEMTSLMTDNDRTLVFDAIRVMTLELGIRFFTDYLEGNVYFNTRFETQNLNRAVVQLKLFENILSQEQEIRDITEMIVSISIPDT